MQTSIIHPYKISTNLWKMCGQCGKSMVFCKLAFISSHERKKKRKTFFVLAVKEYVQCRGVASVILDLSTKCR